MTDTMRALGAVRATRGANVAAVIAAASGNREESFRLHVARPPIEGLEFEVDIRSVAVEAA